MMKILTMMNLMMSEEMEESKDLGQIGPMHDDEAHMRDKCCAKCRYFEERTCFCRFNPPSPIVTYTKSGQPFVTSVYSKINMPMIDWCQKFEK